MSLLTMPDDASTCKWQPRRRHVASCAGLTNLTSSVSHNRRPYLANVEVIVGLADVQVAIEAASRCSVRLHKQTCANNRLSVCAARNTKQCTHSTASARGVVKVALVAWPPLPVDVEVPPVPASNVLVVADDSEDVLPFSHWMAMALRKSSHAMWNGCW